MYSRLALLPLTLVLLLEIAAGQDETVHIQSDLVTIPVSVMDREGRYISDLKPTQFSIYENDKPQKIELFESIDQPISVVIMLDVSGSLIFDIRQLAVAASVFTDQLKKDDQVLAATFSDRILNSRGFLSAEEFKSKGPMKLRVDGLPPETMVFDAVEYSLKKLSKTKGRKAIIFLSDGIGGGVTSSAQSTLRMAEEGDAAIYPIWFDTNSPERSKWESEATYRNRLKRAAAGKAYLQELTARSAGRFYEISSIEHLGKAFGHIVAELSRQYLLGYSPIDPPRPDERRKLVVKVNSPNAIVRSRTEVVFRK